MARWTENKEFGMPWPCCGKPLRRFEDVGLHRCKPQTWNCTLCGGEMTADFEMAPDLEFKGVVGRQLLEYAKVRNRVRHIEKYLCQPEKRSQ